MKRNIIKKKKQASKICEVTFASIAMLVINKTFVFIIAGLSKAMEKQSSGKRNTFPFSFENAQ